MNIDDMSSALKLAKLSVDVTLENNLTAPLEDVGLDSLDMYNLLLELETMTGIIVPDQDLDSLLTIEDIINYYNNHAN